MSTDYATQVRGAVSTLINALPPRPQAVWVDFIEGLPSQVAEAGRQDPLHAEVLVDVIERAALPERMPNQARDGLPAAFYREAIYEHLAGLQRDIDEVQP